MGEKTRILIEELSHLLTDFKYILLQGGAGVGKTYIGVVPILE